MQDSEGKSHTRGKDYYSFYSVGKSVSIVHQKPRTGEKKFVHVRGGQKLGGGGGVALDS